MTHVLSNSLFGWSSNFLVSPRRSRPERDLCSCVALTFPAVLVFRFEDSRANVFFIP
jgi:hypothetical protein